MSKEIERKFLIDPTKLPTLTNTKRITQGYLSLEPAVRIRIIEDMDYKFVDAFITVKEKDTIERDEFEYQIPEEDAHQMLTISSHHWIRKNRSYLNIGNLMWEIDEFEMGFDLSDTQWLAEVELESINQKVELPEWILEEVTEDSRYVNTSLAKNGWPKPPEDETFYKYDDLFRANDRPTNKGSELYGQIEYDIENLIKQYAKNYSLRVVELFMQHSVVTAISKKIMQSWRG